MPDEKRLPAHITEEDVRLICEIVIPAALGAQNTRIQELTQERDELVAQITTIIHDLDRARNNGTVYTYGNIQERLRYALAAVLQIRANDA